MLVRSRLGNGPSDPNFKDCPIFKAWKRIWFASNDPVEKARNQDRARSLFSKNEGDYVLVQILEDQNQPHLVGKFMAMKLPKAIRLKLEAKMNPPKESKKTPYPVMDYIIGLELNMDVTPGPDDPANPGRKQREISYDICEFGDYAPIIQTDGKPLFDDDQLELIDTYVTALKDSTGAKTETRREAAAKKVEELRAQIRPLYQIAFDYVKENAIDIREDQGFREWDEHTATRVNHWIEIVDDGKDPANITYEDWSSGSSTGASDVEVGETSSNEPNEPFGNISDDLPF